jgi:FkbM family methyltransferase
MKVLQLPLPLPLLILILSIILFFLSILMYNIFKKIDKYKNSELNKEITNKLHKTIEYLPKINRIFYPIFYINLKSSKDRELNMKKQINKYNINNITRIEGVNGNILKSLKEGIIYDGTKYKNNCKISKAELGCSLSHLKTIKYIYDLNIDIALILEDDLSFDLMPLWEYSLPELVKNIEYKHNNWNIIRIHNITCNIENNYDKLEIECWGCKAYIINRKGAENIINTFYINNEIIIDCNNFKKGVADFIIYNNIDNNNVCLDYKLPYFFTILNRTSTIHPSHDLQKIKRTNDIINYYLTNNVNKEFININDIDFFDENNNKIDLKNYETQERIDIKYIPKDACVLEIGARHGTVSVAINRHLENPYLHVAIECDKKIISSLIKNRNSANAKFTIINKPLSKTPLYFKEDGVGSMTILNGEEKNKLDTMTYQELKDITGLNFNVLVVDCEGCICKIIEEFPEIIDGIKMILIEKDQNHCDYNKLFNYFYKNNFKLIKDDFHSILIKNL